jgi:hypothetical protein
VAVANAIVEALDGHGVKCWIAPRDVVPGEFHAGAILHAIDVAKVIVPAAQMRPFASFGGGVRQTCRSVGIIRVFQKGDLVRCRNAIEHRVTVRKSTKSIDDFLVRHGNVCPVLFAQLLVQIERKRLIAPILAMFERKVKKEPFLFAHGDVEALFNGTFGKSARDGIG